MARKSRIHYPNALYHVMLRGNGGQDIFFSSADRHHFYLLLQEGIERYKNRIHAFCLMTNHVHLVIQVGEISLSRIMQNVTFRYARYINTKKKRNGHLFQGRYKALLIDGDSYLLELVRYIHCNPVRAFLTRIPEGYQWSSHNAYLGKKSISWLTTDLVLSQFSGQEKKARELYEKFMQEGIAEAQRPELCSGMYESRILGDEGFSKKVVALAAEKWERTWTLSQIIEAVCLSYGIERESLMSPGKKQPGAEARALVAYLVQEKGHLLLTGLGKLVNRDPAALSRAAGRIRERLQEQENSALADKLLSVKDKLSRTKCQD